VRWAIVVLFLLHGAIGAVEPPSLSLETDLPAGATPAGEAWRVRVRVSAREPTPMRLRLAFTGREAASERVLDLTGEPEFALTVSQALPPGPCTLRATLSDASGVVAERTLGDRLPPADPLARIAAHDLAVYESAATPFVWIAARSPTVCLAHGLAASGLGAPTMVWAPLAEGVRGFAPGSAVWGGDLVESWLLLSFAGADGWDRLPGSPYPLDIALLIVLERRPTGVALTGDGLRLAWSERAGRVAVAPLAGTALRRAADTTRWQGRPPRATIATCRRLAARARALPLGLVEDWRIDPIRDVVALRTRVEWWSFHDEWGQAPRYSAPIDPLLALAARSRAPFVSIVGDVVDHEYPLATGAWSGIDGAAESVVELRGLLAHVHRVPLPARAPLDDPLLGAARAALARQVRGWNASPALDEVAPLAALAAYADVDTARRLAGAAASAVAAMLGAPPTDPPAAAQALIECERVAPLVDARLFTGHRAALAALARHALGPPRWGAAGLSTADGATGDVRLGAAIAAARLAWRAGDDAAWRRHSWWSAKQLAARWAAVEAYPRWLSQRDLWAGLIGDHRLVVRDLGGEVRVADAEHGWMVPHDALAYLAPGPANLGLQPGRPPFVGDAAAQALPFAIESCADWLTLLIDDLPRRRQGDDWHRAAFANQSALPPPPEVPPPVAPLLEPGFGPEPRLDLHDALAAVPAADRRRRALALAEANGGVAGREWPIILAGLDTERSPLWQADAAPPRADERFVNGIHRANAEQVGSPVFAIDAPTAGWPTLGWMAPSAPQRRDGVPPLPLCPIAPDTEVGSIAGSWIRVDAHLRAWCGDVATAAGDDGARDAAIAAEAALPWAMSGPLAAAAAGPLPAIADWTPVTAVDQVIAVGETGRVLRRRIRSGEARDAILAIGSDRDVAVYVDGICVHRHLVRRPLRSDDDRVAISLAQGWTTLEIWLPEGGAVAARVADATLAPLVGSEIAAP